MPNHSIQKYSSYEVIFDDKNHEVYLAGIHKNSGTERILEIKLLNLPRTKTRYQLIFSIVDNIMLRTLQSNFSFETDEQAFYLREAFHCLVPKVDTTIQKEHALKLIKKTNKFDVTEFDIVKRFLANNRGGSIAKNKEENNSNIKKNNKATRDADRIKFLRIENNNLEILDGYASDDSDKETNIDEVAVELSRTQINAGIVMFERKKFNTLPNKDNYYKNDQNSLSDDGKQDLDFINQAFKEAQANPNNQRMQFDTEGHVIYKNKKINTLFLVPSFRGINHMNRFSDEVRRERRTSKFQNSLINQPSFSESVLMSSFDFYNDVETWKDIWKNDELITVLKDNAIELEQQLLKLKNKDFILVHNLSAGKNHFFSNWLHAAQHIYSNGIVKLLRIQRLLLEKNNISLALLNAYNPFVSESETPYHAMRYACGLKSLYEPASRKPCYNKNGKPAFPYIGEISITLRPISTIASEYERNVVRQLSNTTSIQASREIKPELEATGFGWLRENEIVHSETVKCPNFQGKYKKQYSEKFGLSKSLFYKFKSAIIEAKTDAERDIVEQHLLKWLCHYKTVELMEKATALAKQRGCEIAFKASDIGLTAQIPNIENIAIDKSRIEMLITLADKLYKDISNEKILFKEKLNSDSASDTIFYSVEETQVIKALKALGYSTQEINQFILQENNLRTPPSAEPQPRTALKYSPGVNSPYKTYNPFKDENDLTTSHDSAVPRANLLSKFSSVFTSPSQNKPIDNDIKKLEETLPKLKLK